ncbi:hypothetical protein ACFVIM_18685 [Streptomyces sp. NPDC057638]|uniref:hypothetical protein n=1 Tax=Streptomyces sp. NPDC057638 TaxID=3346190 RepID=UPI00367F5689
MTIQSRFIRKCGIVLSGGALITATLTGCSTAPSTPSAPDPGPATVSAPPEGVPVPGTGTIPVPDGAGHDADAELPAAVRRAAAGFTAAWASHDARPGKDRSYTDAGKRAAAFASADLGAAISAPRPSTASLWARWTKDRTRVTATVTKVSVPDGAPAPTRTSALARVLYRLTTAPAKGKATSELKQVALQLERGGDGEWRVIALPYA